MNSFVLPQTVHTDLTFSVIFSIIAVQTQFAKHGKHFRATDTENVLEIITQVALIITFNVDSDYFGVQVHYKWSLYTFLLSSLWFLMK